MLSLNKAKTLTLCKVYILLRRNRLDHDTVQKHVRYGMEDDRCSGNKKEEGKGNKGVKRFNAILLV